MGVQGNGGPAGLHMAGQWPPGLCPYRTRSRSHTLLLAVTDLRRAEARAGGSNSGQVVKGSRGRTH